AAEQPVDFGLWVLEQWREADFVLVVASPAYRRRAEGTEEAGQGRGVRWEARLIREAFYEDEAAARRRILPVVLPGTTTDAPPVLFARTSPSHYDIPEIPPPGIEPLLRVLTPQPFEVAPELGQVPDLPSRAAIRNELVLEVRVDAGRLATRTLLAGT